MLMQICSKSEFKLTNPKPMGHNSAVTHIQHHADDLGSCGLIAAHGRHVQSCGSTL